jgi:hypothetical protein
MQEDYRIRARSNVMTLTRTRAGLPGNQIGAYCDAALRNFGRCRGMADIGQVAPIRLD